MLDHANVILIRVEELSKKKGVTMAQVATAWCISKPGNASVLCVSLLLSEVFTRFPGVGAPIIGTTSLQNLQEAIGEIDIETKILFVD